MSANAPTHPQIDIGLGSLTLLGEHEGHASIAIEDFSFEDNAMAASKINDRFKGQCILTVSWATRAPHFIFTMNVGEHIKDPFGFLKKVRRELNMLEAEIKLLVQS